MVVFKGILAVTNEYVIGKDMALPWNIEKDKNFFREITKGKKLLMGRKTFQGIKKLDENTKYYVIASEKVKYERNNVIGITSYEEIFDLDEIWVSGGARLYNELLPKCDEIYVTYVKNRFEGNIKIKKFEEGFVIEKVIYEDSDIKICKLKNIN